MITREQEFVVPPPKRDDFTFAELVQDREVEFPTLARAVRNNRPANSVRIEWLIDRLNPDRTITREVWHNYTQIFRLPYQEARATLAGEGDFHEKRRVEFLTMIERTLGDGQPYRDPNVPVMTCGGYRHYLGRDLNEADIIELRPLREPLLWTHEWKFSPEHGWYPLDTPTYEWLAETSLVVIPQAP